MRSGKKVTHSKKTINNIINECYLRKKPTGASSVGRAIDCRSIGHWFDSGAPDLIRKCEFSTSVVVNHMLG